MSYRVGLNGLGRIGRALVRLFRNDDAVQITAINDLADIETAAHLLRHDSVHGAFPGTVEVRDDRTLLVDSRAISYSRAGDPAAIPWEVSELKTVVEATGRFSRGDAARGHDRNGLRRVLVTAVCPGADRTVVFRATPGEIPPEARVVSTASCTTHAACQPLRLLDDWYGIEAAEMTTVHCTTGSQVTMDLPHRDLRRARSSLISMIPTTTSAQRGIVEALPQLDGRLSCLAIRVPTATVSLVEIVAQTSADAEQPSRIGRRFIEASEGPLAGILGVSDEPLVSIDYCGDPRSCIVDLPLIERPGARLVRIVGWYDNEWGYANRVADLLRVFGEED